MGVELLLTTDGSIAIPLVGMVAKVDGASVKLTGDGELTGAGELMIGAAELTGDGELIITGGLMVMGSGPTTLDTTGGTGGKLMTGAGEGAGAKLLAMTLLVQTPVKEDARSAMRGHSEILSAFSESQDLNAEVKLVKSLARVVGG